MFLEFYYFFLLGGEGCVLRGSSREVQVLLIPNHSLTQQSHPSAHLTLPQPSTYPPHPPHTPKNITNPHTPLSHPSHQTTHPTSHTHHPPTHLPQPLAHPKRPTTTHQLTQPSTHIPFYHPLQTSTSTIHLTHPPA